MKKITKIIFTIFISITAFNIYAQTEYLKKIDPMTDAISHYAIITGDKGEITFGCNPKGSSDILFTGLPFDPFEDKGTMRAFKVRFDKTKMTTISPGYLDGAFHLVFFLDQGNAQADFLYKIMKHKKLIISSKKGIYTYNLDGSEGVLNKVLSLCNLSIEAPRSQLEICKKDSKGKWMGPHFSMGMSSKSTCELLNKPTAKFKKE